jgi:hypothetical protein
VSAVCLYSVWANGVNEARNGYLHINRYDPALPEEFK